MRGDNHINVLHLLLGTFCLLLLWQPGSLISSCSCLSDKEVPGCMDQFLFYWSLILYFNSVAGCLLWKLLYSQIGEKDQGITVNDGITEMRRTGIQHVTPYKHQYKINSACKQANMEQYGKFTGASAPNYRYAKTWIIFILCVLFLIQVISLSIFPVLKKSCLYIMNDNENIHSEEQFQQCIEGNRTGVINHTGLRNSKLATRHHGSGYKNKTKISHAVLRRHLKVLMNESAENSLFTSTPTKRKLTTVLFSTRTDHLHQSKVRIFPFTVSLNNFLNEVQNRSELPQELEMCHEIRRLISFSGSRCPASSLRLAHSGFYASGRGPETRCYSCGVMYSDWHLMDRPECIHRRISPECLHLVGGDIRNIPIQPEQRIGNTSNRVNGLVEDYQISLQDFDGIAATSSSVANLTVSDEEFSPRTVISTLTPTSTSTPVLASDSVSASMTARPPSNLDISRAVHPQYSDLLIRLHSYQGWGWSRVQNPQVLSEAGFYYAGYRDCVRCFYCGVGLRTWEKEDDPWVEHVRWRSSCDYVRCMKGEQFVIGALAGYSLSEAGSPLPPVNNNMPTRLQDKNTTDEYKTRSESTRVTSTSTTQGRQSIPPERPVPSSVSPQSQSTRDTSPASSLAGMSSAREVMETFPIQILKLNTPGATTNMAAEDDNSMNPSTNIKRQNIDGLGQMTLQRQLEQTTLQSQLEEENQSLRDESTCKVCLDNPSCIVFLPCGHLVTCAECAPALRKCPVCRALIRGTVRAYCG